MTRALLVLATLLCAVYAINYSNTVQLNNNYGISWNIVGDRIQLKLEVNTTGWVGFGIAEQTSGSMPGADIVTVIVHDDKTVEIADRFATQKAMPEEDVCSHWSLTSATESNGMTIVEVNRLLETGDEQDRPITPGLMKIIYAYGTSDTFGYHGDNRFFSSVTFIPGAPLPQSDPNWKSIDLSVTYNVPSATTTYACTTHVLTFDTDVHLVQFEVLINSTNKAWVHHILMYRCSTNNTQWFANRNKNTQTCDALPGETDGSCHEVVWGWAHGAYQYIVPDNIGFRAGPSTDAIKWLEVQVHYDNPNSLSTIVDNSGVRLFYTETLRTYDAGVVTLGDPATSGKDIPPGVALTEYEYTCSPGCTNNLPGDVQVFGSLFHMHELGARGWTKLWRGTQDMGYTTRVEYYDFGFQEFVPLNFTLKKGDRLQTHCAYDSRTRTTPTPFGSPSNQEMCMDFVMYYPRVPDWDFCGFIDFGARNYTICGLTPIDETNPTNVDPYGGILPVFGTDNIAVCNGTSLSTTSTTGQEMGSTTAMHDSSAGRVGVVTVLIVLFVAMLFV